MVINAQIKLNYVFIDFSKTTILYNSKSFYDIIKIDGNENIPIYKPKNGCDYQRLFGNQYVKKSDVSSK